MMKPSEMNVVSFVLRLVLEPTNHNKVGDKKCPVKHYFMHCLQKFDFLSVEYCKVTVFLLK